MSDKQKDDKYQGPGQAASAIGDSALYAVGSPIVGGAAVAAGSHLLLKEDGKQVKEVAQAAIENSRDTHWNYNPFGWSPRGTLRNQDGSSIGYLEDRIKDLKKGQTGPAGHGMEIGSPEHAEWVEQQIARHEAEIAKLEELAPKFAKSAMAVHNSAIAASVLLPAGLVYGAFHGWQKATHGQKQFAQLKQERDQATTRADQLQTQMNGVTQILASGRPTQGSYAETIREQQAQGANKEAAL